MNSREQIEAEARAKITWGESPAAVFGYLRSQGIAPAEARELMNALQAERLSEVRAAGVRKIIFGALLMISPFAYWFISVVTIGRIFLYVLAAAIIGAFYGLSKLIDGLRAVAAPKSVSSDLSED